MEVNNNKSFIDRHPNVTTVCSVIVWVITLAIMWAFTSCKGSQNVVEIHTSDTIHVWHTDTMKIVHNDTVYSVKVETKHDSIIIKEKYYLDADGNVTLTEKEKESYHNNEKDSQFIQHTVDSLLQAKMDSIYNSSHEDKPVVVEKQKSWWEKFTDWVKRPFLFIGIAVVIGAIIWFAWKTK